MNNKVIIDLMSSLMVTMQLGFAVFLHRRRRKFVRDGITSEATIIEINGRGDKTECLLQYKTVTGEIITGSSRSSSVQKKKIGYRVPIYYDPASPSKFMIDGFAEKYAAAMMLLSALLVVIMYFTILREKFQN